VGQHDRSYRSLFSFPKMVEDLIRQFVPEAWVDKLDFSTLQRVTPSFISPEIEEQPEELWALCLRDGSPVYVYLFIEHRPEVDPFLSIHLMANVALLYQDLIRKEKLTSDGRLPLIIPIVLHHGETDLKEPSELIAGIEVATESYVPRLRCKVVNEGRFSLEDLESRQSATAQVFLMEQTRDWDALTHGARRLGSFMDRLEDGPLREALLEWLDEMMITRRQERRRIPEELNHEDFMALLSEMLEHRNHILRERERQEGQENFLLRLLEHKFGQLDPKARQRVRSANSERQLDWAVRILAAERLEDVFN
jgi:hypothetical protein